jgi:hypothetical protein
LTEQDLEKLGMGTRARPALGARQRLDEDRSRRGGGLLGRARDYRHRAGIRRRAAAHLGLRLAAGAVAPARHRRARVLPAGRVSLSAYIGESLLLSLLFSGYGGGLFGTLGAASVALIALQVWALLDLLGHRILARWKAGPLEWLLRRFVTWRTGSRAPASAPMKSER